MKKVFMLSLFFGILFVALIGSSANGRAGVDVNIGINIPPPPRLVISAPPEVVVIPGTYIYFVPTLDVDVFFYHGYWYRPHHGHWYRASSYNGHWVILEDRRVPNVLVHVPGDFRRLPPGYRHIPHRELHSNWKAWEKNKYWEKQEYWHHRQHEAERRDDRHERKEDRYDRKDYDKGGGKGKY
jgi:hypothetical protein